MVAGRSDCLWVSTILALLAVFMLLGWMLGHQETDRSSEMAHLYRQSTALYALATLTLALVLTTIVLSSRLTWFRGMVLVTALGVDLFLSTRCVIAYIL